MKTTITPGIIETIKSEDLF